MNSDAGGLKPLSHPGSVIGDAFHDEEEEKQFTTEAHALGMHPTSSLSIKSLILV